MNTIAHEHGGSLVTRINGNPEIAIWVHQGMGDQIECNGLIRSYLDKYLRIFVFAKPPYIDMIKYMYRDTSRIEVLPTVRGSGPKTPDQPEVISSQLKLYKNQNIDWLTVGYQYYNDRKFRGENCNQIFYNIAGVPYEDKVPRFFYKREIKEEERVYQKLNPQNEDYIFVHDDPERGFYINIKSDKKIIKNDKSENIFYMRKILEKASEIHCMNSAIYCWIEYIETTDNLYHYPLRSHGRGQLKKWKSVSKNCGK